MPESFLGRIGTYFLRLPFAVTAFVLTQNTTHQVRALKDRIGRAGFPAMEAGSYLAGTIKFFAAEKPES